MIYFVPSRRLATFLLVLAGSAVLPVYLFVLGPYSSYSGQQPSRLSPLDSSNSEDPPKHDRVPCVGPRGKLLGESPDDQLYSRILAQEYPRPLGGSYKALGLNETWMTADDRYGPYGLGDEAIGTYLRSRVEWNSIDWALLQDNCLASNRFRFRKARNIIKHPTLSIPTKVQRVKLAVKNSLLRGSRRSTGRTAIVVRSWGNYNYQKADMINLRSLIVETSLSSGGEYSVFLLVHIKDRSKEIFSSLANYQAALNAAVPPELRSIAVLFDESLLEAWYPKVGEHSPYLQIAQPMQLFAQTFDGFDHYWQWEMDTRLTSNTLDYLEAMSNFAKAAPRKQAFERGSFRYIPDVHGGSYNDLLAMVNSSVHGRGVWGALRIPEIQKPVGRPPSTTDPIHDNFQWGVGEEADFIPTVPCKSLPLTTSWLFWDILSGFAAGKMTPRLFCPQAVSRMSWTLLDAVHTAQVEQGLYIPSEATMPSFTLWHGLKYSQPPQPWFIQAREDIPQDAHGIDQIVNGGPPKSEHAGFAFGTNSHNQEVLDHYNWRTEQNWHWRSNLPQNIMDTWLGYEGATINGSGLENILRVQDGQVYAPIIWLHPYKTNAG